MVEREVSRDLVNTRRRWRLGKVYVERHYHVVTEEETS